MTLSGSSFFSGTVALFDGLVLNTTFVSATQANAVIPAAQLTSARTAKVQIAGAGMLNASSPAAGLAFQVTNQTPAISALTPDTAAQDTNGLMTVSGSNFAPGAVLLPDGQAVPTVFVSATQVRAQIAAVLLPAGRVVQVAVQNAGPSGRLSNELPFLVTAPRIMILPLIARR